MKKILFYTIIICLCVVLIVGSLIGSMQIKKQLFLDGFFKNWENQDNVPNYSMYRTVFHYENKKYNIYDIESTTQEIFCIVDNEIFFVHTKKVQDGSYGQIWCISSVNVVSNKKTLWYSGTFTAENSQNIQYSKLSQYSDIDNLCGGMINGDNIYLKDSSHTVSFNIKTKEISEESQIPSRRFEWTVIPASYVEIIDKERNTSIRIDKEQFFEENEYAKELKTLNNKKTISGYGFCDEFFCKMVLVDEKLYIVCEVFNFVGDAFAIVFQYDYENDNISYILSEKVGTRVFHDFVMTK